MNENRVKTALNAGKTVIGTGLGITANPNVVRLLAGVGYDFLFIDIEHNLISPENLMTVVQMARACNISCMVRVQDTEYHLLANTLDSGADGLIVPRVESKTQAECIVAYSKFPPQGVRGCGTTAPLDFNRQGEWGPALAWLNDQSLIATQVESMKALDTLPEMLQVPGIDLIVVGPLDLSINLGVPGQFNHPKFVTAVERVIQICQTHNVPSGIVLATPEALKPWWEKGMRFLVCSNDFTMIKSTATDHLRAVRDFACSR